MILRRGHLLSSQPCLLDDALEVDDEVEEVDVVLLSVDDWLVLLVEVELLIPNPN